jgi:hypothetical protein
MSLLKFEEAPRRAALRPVLYLDLDDTVLKWTDGNPGPAEGAREFVLWSLDRFEVRWLTRWCPTGEMEERLLRDLCRMLELDPAVFRHVRGFDWESTGSKLNGIAWLEHVVLKRPFLWVEDEYGVGERELSTLRALGLERCYLHCNVSEDPLALRALYERLAGSTSRRERSA